MPTVVNLTSRPLGPTTLSVRCWLYLAPWADPTLPPLTSPIATVEDGTLQTARFVVYECFTQKNANGTLTGRGSIDARRPTIQEFKATTPEELLANALT